MTYATSIIITFPFIVQRTDVVNTLFSWCNQVGDDKLIGDTSPPTLQTVMTSLCGDMVAESAIGIIHRLFKKTKPHRVYYLPANGYPMGSTRLRTYDDRHFYLTGIT